MLALLCSSSPMGWVAELPGSVCDQQMTVERATTRNASFNFMDFSIYRIKSSPLRRGDAEKKKPQITQISQIKKEAYSLCLFFICVICEICGYLFLLCVSASPR